MLSAPPIALQKLFADSRFVQGINLLAFPNEKKKPLGLANILQWGVLRIFRLIFNGALQSREWDYSPRKGVITCVDWLIWAGNYHFPVQEPLESIHGQEFHRQRNHRL